MTQLYAIFAWDSEGAETRREDARDAHFAHVENIIDSIAVAGPLKTSEGGFAGSLVVVKADSLEIATAILKSDPYYKAGVWDRYEIHPFVAAAGEWIGGKIW